MKIQSDSALRLNLILEREGLSQKDFSDIIGLSKTTVNNICRGRSRLTANVASIIHKFFPQYRLDYLVGNDDYMTAEDAKNGFYAQLFDEIEREDAAVKLLLARFGYSASQEKNGIAISQGNELVCVVPAIEFAEFCGRIVDFAEFSALKMIQRFGGTENE